MATIILADKGTKLIGIILTDKGTKLIGIILTDKGTKRNLTDRYYID